jgi:N-methylhydantoinase A
VTDANVVLGYLNPCALAGGSVPVDSQLAREAIQRCIAQPLDREIIETAFGIHCVANANMMRPIKMVTTYRGRDPRGFALMAFGGSGGVHAVALARQLQIERVVVPPAAGVFSALGLLLADAQVNVSRAFHRLSSEMDGEEAERMYAELEHQAVAALRRDPGEVSFHRLADLRYAGQAFELTIDLPTGPMNAAAMSELSDRFEGEHERVYGNSFAGEYPLEIVNLRVIGSVLRRASDEVTIDAAPCDDDEVTEATRDAYFGPDCGMLKTPVLNRQGLTGRTLRGPLIIEEYEGTIVVPPDCSARVDETGNMVFDLGGQT